MKIIRLKAVSQCLGIRRSYLAYIPYENGMYSLEDLAHPMKIFKNIIVDNNNLKALDNEELLENEEIFFYKNRKVVSLNKELIEQCVLGCLAISLNDNMIEYYIESINDDIRYDEFDGEYEFLIALIYEYIKNDLKEAKKWYDKAYEKGFNYKIIKG